MLLKKIVSILMVLLLLTGVFVGCSNNDNDQPTSSDQPQQNNDNNDDPKQPEKKILRITEGSDIPGLDQSIATDAVSFEVLGNALEGLYTLIGGNEIGKGVAESYTLSEDGLTYTFKLRDDSIWNNGEPVTAQDFVYSWKRLASPDTGSQYAFMIETAGIKNGSAIIKGEKPVEELGVRAENEKTLVVELDAPVPFFINLMTFPTFFPLNQEFVESFGEDFGTSRVNTLYNGPYTLTKWETEYEFILTKNDKYWNKAAINIDEINYRIIKDPNTALSMYETGQIDSVGLVGENIKDYIDDAELVSTPDTAVAYLQFNQDNKILANKNARIAFALAFDKSFITEEILGNGSLIADYWVPYNLATGPDGKDFRETTGTYNSYNKEEAKKYWTKAKEELGIDSAKIDFLTFDGETSRRISEFVQSQLQNNLEGLTVTIQQQPFNNKLALEDEGQFDFSFAIWGPDYGDPMTFLDMWITESGYNALGFSSKEYDSIIESCKTGNLTTDLPTRWSELQRAEKILLEEAIIAPIYQRAGTGLRKPYVKNWKTNAFAPDHYWGLMDIQK